MKKTPLKKKKASAAKPKAKAKSKVKTKPDKTLPLNDIRNEPDIRITSTGGGLE